jgi:hypothetical protein
MWMNQALFFGIFDDCGLATFTYIKSRTYFEGRLCLSLILQDLGTLLYPNL